MTDRIITYSEAIREAIGQAMEADPNVFMLGEDIGDTSRQIRRMLRRKYRCLHPT
jgi:pyruvate/2-oxoglutarate/acetoin dehydrogenase E1 component